MVVGVDLVKWQLLIASGEKLIIKQEELSQRGHAIECRIYAEDPENSFLPSPGKILYQKEPEGPGVRLDNGIFTGFEVTPYYDPILSKLIVWGENRDTAIKGMVNALDNYIILGVKTTGSYLRELIQHPEFIKGNTCTDFIDKNMKDRKKIVDDDLIDLSLITASFSDGNIKMKKGVSSDYETISSPWESIGKWEIGS